MTGGVPVRCGLLGCVRELLGRSRPLRQAASCLLTVGLRAFDFAESPAPFPVVGHVPYPWRALVAKWRSSSSIFVVPYVAMIVSCLGETPVSLA